MRQDAEGREGKEGGSLNIFLHFLFHHILPQPLVPDTTGELTPLLLNMTPDWAVNFHYSSVMVTTGQVSVFFIILSKLYINKSMHITLLSKSNYENINYILIQTFHISCPNSEDFLNLLIDPLTVLMSSNSSLTLLVNLIIIMMTSLLIYDLNGELRINNDLTNR